MTEAELAFDCFKAFSAVRGLGRPDKVLSLVPASGIFGVGAQWGEGEEAIRTAYKVSSQEAADDLESLMIEYVS